MPKVDILSTIIQFPGHIFAKIIVFLHGLPKAVAEKTNVFFYLFEKIKTLFKNPLRVFNIINIVYTIYVPSLINQKRVQRIGLSKVKMSSPQLFTAKSFDCNKENGPKSLNFLNVLIHSQCNLFTLNIHQIHETSTKR